MTVNYEEQNIEKLTVDQSDNTSIHSENPARIEDIFEWIDGIPLSKTTKNLARDFSDAVLMSEILKFYYPHLVNVHNYIPANSVNNKKENWNTLNRKVLSKIDLRLNPETIDQLSHSQNGIIDKILIDFRDKQLAIKIKEKEFQKSDFNQIDQSNVKSSIEEQFSSNNYKSKLTRTYETFKYFFIKILQIILTIICFWKWFSKKPECKLIQINTINVQQHKGNRSKISAQTYHHEEENQSHEVDQAKKLQELHLKKEMIKSLCHKVAFLERTMKLKDLKIETLTNHLEQNTPEIVALSSARPNIPLANNSKLRRRPRTQK